MDQPDPQQAHERRLIALEEWMMHAEQLLSELNEVACSFQERLDRQDQTIRRLSEALQHYTSPGPEKRTLEDDRPPHY